jgi:simple sugar transport system permease protein
MLISVLFIAAPLILAAVAGYLPFRAGILNIGLEGLMALGAFFGFIAAAVSGSWLMGILAGSLAGAIAATFFAWTVLRLEANIFLSGLGLNLAAAGLLGIVSQLAFGTKGVLRPGLLNPAGVFPPDHGIISIIGAGLAFAALMLLMRKSRWGHRLIAAGESPETLKNLGHSVKIMRFQSLVLSGIGCGAAGALLALDIGAYVPNMTGGRGWIALVALYIAGKRPLGLLATVLLFSAANAAATVLQGMTGIPDSLLLASPFFITFLGLVVAGILRTLAESQQRRKQRDITPHEVGG